MVKQGPYTVEIVRARTKTPFPEHTMKDGATYVEAEADQEYFILVKADSKDKVVANIYVDGKYLDYVFTCSKAISTQYRSKWERRDGKEYNYALKFKKKGQENKHSTTSNHLQPGKIEITFSEYICLGYSATYDYQNGWNGGDDNYVNGITDPDKKKTVKSVVGSQFEVTQSSTKSMKYKAGTLLDTVTLYYCSSKALVDMEMPSTGITYDHYLENRPYEPDPDFHPPKPVLMKQQMEIGGRMQTVEMDTYDLTGEDD